MSRDLTDQFRQEIENDSNATDLERIEKRSCTSNNYDGVQYNFFGTFVPIRPIIDVVAEVDDCAIESLHHTDDGDHTCLGVFVADIPQQPHPAFVN